MPRRKSRRQRSQTAPNTLGGKTATTTYLTVIANVNSTLMTLALVRPTSPTNSDPETILTLGVTTVLDTSDWNIRRRTGAIITIASATMAPSGMIDLVTLQNRGGNAILTIPQFNNQLSAPFNAPFAGACINLRN